jgi:hypothetical protein
MSVSHRRAAAIAETVARVRAIEAEQGIGRAALAAIEAELIALGARADLFPLADFPVPAGRTGEIYRLSEDADRRFALYASAGVPGKAQPPHNHTTWAVIAGGAWRRTQRVLHALGRWRGAGARHAAPHRRARGAPRQRLLVPGG